MEYFFGRIRPKDRDILLNLFGRYVEESFDAFAEAGIPLEPAQCFLDGDEDHPAVSMIDDKGDMVGFGMLKPYLPYPTFVRALEISYFIRPELAGQGLAVMMLEHLSHLAAERGASSLLICIASLNQEGLDFHLKHGFYQCACFHRIGIKDGREFDLVWLQKPLWDYLEEIEENDGLEEF